MAKGQKGFIMKNIKIVRAKYTVDSSRRKGKAVMCLDTSEAFTSAKECADLKGFKYTNFVYALNHGTMASDGKLYCYVADMAYYAPEIQHRIYNKAKAEYDNAKMTMMKYEKMFDSTKLM